MTVTASTAEALSPPEGVLVPAGSHHLHLTELGDPAGKPTVLLHGGGPGCTAWTDFWPTLPYLGERRLILVNMLNWGRSSAVRITAPRWSYQAEHIAEALRNYGVETADFICNSIGGSAALALAADHPALVRSLVVTGSAPAPGGVAWPEYAEEGKSAWATYWAAEGPTPEKSRRIMARLEYVDDDAVDPRLAALRYEQSLSEGQRVLSENFPSNMGAPEDLTQKMGRIQARVLFLYGLQDIWADPTYPVMLAGLVPNGDVFLMNGGGHHVEEELPERYASVALNWLDLPAGVDPATAA